MAATIKQRIKLVQQHLVFSPVVSVMQKIQRWRELICQVIPKQHAKIEQTDAVCLHTMQKYEKVESINTQNDYETTGKK